MTPATSHGFAWNPIAPYLVSSLFMGTAPWKLSAKRRAIPPPGKGDALSPLILKFDWGFLVTQQVVFSTMYPLSRSFGLTRCGECLGST